jgi:hypothetical protein
MEFIDNNQSPDPRPSVLLYKKIKWLQFHANVGSAVLSDFSDSVFAPGKVSIDPSSRASNVPRPLGLPNRGFHLISCWTMAFATETWDGFVPSAFAQKCVIFYIHFFVVQVLPFLSSHNVKQQQTKLQWGQNSSELDCPSRNAFWVRHARRNRGWKVRDV